MENPNIYNDESTTLFFDRSKDRDKHTGLSFSYFTTADMILIHCSYKKKPPIGAITLGEFQRQIS